MNSQQDFLDDIRQIATKKGRRQAAVIMSSQHIHEIEAIADHILVLHDGACVEARTNVSNNTFQVWGPSLDVSKLKTCLDRIGGSMPIKRPSYCLIRVPVVISQRQFIDALYDHGVEFTYFRNITSSASLLFEHQFNM